MVATETGVPARYREPENDAAVTVILAWGSMPLMPSFHASSWRRPEYIGGGTGVDWKEPSKATPVLWELKPPACAPITAERMPPARPSNAWPWRSTGEV